MISILFIHQSSDLYGSDKTLLLLLQQLDKKKYTPVVVLPLSGPLKEELEKIDNPNLEWESQEWRNIILALRAYKIFEQKYNMPPKLINLQ